MKAGFYGQPPLRRQRFKCVPDDAAAHRFTPPLPRVLTPEGECLDCERDLASHEGPQVVRRYRFHTRDVAEALVAVADGSSYREASANIRASAGRPGRRPHSQLVADWVETFSPALWSELGTDRWPEVIVCDSTRISRRSTAASGLARYPHRRSEQKKMARVTVYTLLVATALHRGRWKAVMAQAVPGNASQADWAGFFRLLDGRPRAVVGDQASMVFNAVQTVWPATPNEAAPQPVWCVHHVKDTFLFPAWVVRPSNAAEIANADRFKAAFSECARSAQHWDAFVQLARQLDPGPSLESWLAWNGRDRQMRAQLAARQPGDPQSNSSVEEAIRWFKRRLADRPFTNAERTNRLLRLMVLSHRGDADPRGWSHTVRDHATAHAGHAGTHHRTIADPKGARSL